MPQYQSLNSRERGKLRLAVVWSLPMFSKLDFQNVREADALMHFLRTDHRIRFNALPKFGMVKSPTYTRRSLIGTRRGLMPVKALSTGANFSDPPFLSLQTTQGGSPSSWRSSSCCLSLKVSMAAKKPSYS